MCSLSSNESFLTIAVVASSARWVPLENSKPLSPRRPHKAAFHDVAFAFGFSQWKKKKHSWTTYVVVYFTATRDPLEVSQFRNSMRETRVPKEPRCSKISRFIDFECISFFLSFFDFPPVRKEKGNIMRLISMNLINVIVTYLYLFEFLSINLL